MLPSTKLPECPHVTTTHSCGYVCVLACVHVWVRKRQRRKFENTCIWTQFDFAWHLCAWHARGKSEVSTTYFLLCLSTLLFETGSHWPWYSVVSYTSSPLTIALGWYAPCQAQSFMGTGDPNSVPHSYTASACRSSLSPAPYINFKMEKAETGEKGPSEENWILFHTSQGQFPAPTR